LPPPVRPPPPPHPRAITRLAKRPGVISLADERLSLGLTKALVRRCALLVTTDSGPRHFAAAFDRPVVSLYGPTFIDWTRTYFAKEINLQKKVPCGPCQLRVCPTDHACMNLLTPQEVLAAAHRLLHGSLQKAVGTRRSRFLTGPAFSSINIAFGKLSKWKVQPLAA
jgi:ADP-heptose:LPS heptosyltransferase